MISSTLPSVMEKPTVTLGVDLGTTYTIVSFWNPETCKLESLDPFRSSAQFVNGKENACVTNQTRGVALCPKRLIGKKFVPSGKYSPIIYGLEVCDVKVGSGNGQSYDRYVPGYVVPGKPEKKVAATYVDTLILKHVKSAVEKKLGDKYKANRVVITIPVAFSWEQKMETYRAAVEAGFTDVSLQQEPVMAAYHYCTEKGLTNKTILVYDFGGGTFDVCLVRFENNCFTILNFDGDEYLGGEDITNSIAELIEESLSCIYKGWKTTCTPNQRASIENAIRQKSEEIKRSLTTLETITINARCFSFKWNAEFTVDMHSTNIIQLVDQSLKITHSLLKGESVDFVLLAGGTSDSSIVRNQLKKEFHDKLKTDVDPKSCVSMGAAKFGHENPEFKVVDGQVMVYKVLGKSIGCKTKNGNKYIANKGDTLPKEGVLKFQLTKDDDGIYTKLIEGENVIKNLNIKLDKVYPKDTQFQLKLKISEDLLIYYEVVNLDTNKVIFDLGMVQLGSDWGCLLRIPFWRDSYTLWLCLHSAENEVGKLRLLRKSRMQARIRNKPSPSLHRSDRF